MMIMTAMMVTIMMDWWWWWWWDSEDGNDTAAADDGGDDEDDNDDDNWSYDDGEDDDDDGDNGDNDDDDEIPLASSPILHVRNWNNTIILNPFSGWPKQKARKSKKGTNPKIKWWTKQPTWTIRHRGETKARGSNLLPDKNYWRGGCEDSCQSMWTMSFLTGGASYLEMTANDSLSVFW